MRRIVLLIIGIAVLSFQAQAEDNATVPGTPCTSTEVEDHVISSPKENPAEETPTIIKADKPVGPSMQEALAAPEDPYVEDKDLNTDEDESPDEADEDGEEGNDEDGDEEGNDEDGDEGEYCAEDPSKN